MIRSMTGYGRAESLREGRRLVVEVKSLNHRYMEVFVRLPGSIQSLEAEVKKKVVQKLARGRIEIGVRMDSEAVQEIGRIDLNIPMIQHYYSLLVRLKETLHLKDEISLGMLTGFRDAFTYQETEVDLEQVWKDLEPVLEEALDAMTAMRCKEGQVIGIDIQMRTDLIKRCLDVIASRAPQVVKEYHKKLSDRVKELTGGIPVDEIRLSQEVAILADRMDITEEIVRFRSHVDQLEAMLISDEAAGRKVDFLLQEMNREVNTMGSKSGDSDISHQVVEIKGELSKLREQVQNIE